LQAIDLSGELDGEVFQPLRDEAVFRQVTVDEFGAVCWPNGPNLAPDAIHSELPESRRLSPDHSRRRPNATPPRNRQEAPRLGRLPARDEVQVLAVRRGSGSSFDRARCQSAAARGIGASGSYLTDETRV
jgi:hypothetical protein